MRRLRERRVSALDKESDDLMAALSRSGPGSKRGMSSGSDGDRCARRAAASARRPGRGASRARKARLSLRTAAKDFARRPASLSHHGRRDREGESGLPKTDWPANVMRSVRES